MKTIFSTLTWEHHQNGTAAPLKWDRIVPAAIINNYRVNDQISFQIPLEFMKKKAAATTAAVPFHWCTLWGGHCNRSDQFQESAPVKWDGGDGGGRLFLHEF